MKKRREKTKPQSEAVIFLLYRNGNVFIEKRLKIDSKYYGYYLIPGGSIESFDKDKESAVCREAFEEKGVKPKNIVYLGSFIDRSFSDNLGVLNNNHAYLIDDFEGEPVEREPEKAELLEVSIGKAEDYLEIGSSKLIILWARQKLGM